MRTSTSIPIIVCVAGALLLAGTAGVAECFYCSQSCQVCCPAGGGCLYAPTTGYCYTSCTSTGGGGGCDPLSGIRPCGVAYVPADDRDPIALSLSSVPLDEALGIVAEKAGVSIIAPSLRDRTVTLHESGLTARAIVDQIAKQVGALPVFRGAIQAIELVPRAEIAKRSFSRTSLASAHGLTMSFSGLPAASAVRLIANSAGVDIVVSPGLQGVVSGTFDDMEWPELLQAVLDASGGARMRIASNGLVWIEL